MTKNEVIDRVRNSDGTVADLKTLTSFGGRLVGSKSEADTLAWLRRRLLEIPSISLSEHEFLYDSWTCTHHRLEICSGGEKKSLRCHPLVWSAPTDVDGLCAEIVDLKRGTPDDFQSSEIVGKIVLVRHEYPFAQNTIHRRIKYARSRELGAAGFIIANNIDGELLVTGSCGQDLAANIPGLGISMETGAELASSSEPVRAELVTIRAPKHATNLIAEIAGKTDEWIVVSAHYDGHDLAQSALDNATGVAAAITILQSFAPLVGTLQRGLRVILFSAEESGLLGSTRYVDSLAPTERSSIALDINLDTLAGSTRFSCLTSGFEDLNHFVGAVSAAAGIEIPCYLPLLRNSDHYNFARLGIPALRVIAGFDEPTSGARFLLTEGDTAEKVSSTEIKLGTIIATELVWSALTWPGTIAQHRTTAD
jgi:Zn-dependent M28 family amino/carboxypeptidase